MRRALALPRAARDLAAGFRRERSGAVAVEYAILIGMVSLIVVGVVAVAAAVTGIYDALPGYFP